MRCQLSGALRKPKQSDQRVTAEAFNQNHLREDIGKVDEPQFKAMFETAAEVLGGLAKAFGDYQKKSEKAWQR